MVPDRSPIVRTCWRQRIEDAWRERRIVWLSGPRRLGKTTLARTLPDVEYFDCDLPSVRRDADDTEAFLRRHRGRRVVLDEIHRLGDPSGLLKVAADHFPDVHLLATGSSTLGASARFRDTLAGRKRRKSHACKRLSHALGNHCERPKQSGRLRSA